MPRFGMKSLLIGMTVFALWLMSPFIAVDGAGVDIRRSLLLLILIAAGTGAIYQTAWWRAFWIGFSAAMLITVAKVPGYSLELTWIPPLISRFVSPRTGNQFSKLYSSLFFTGHLACILLLSTIAGLIAGYVYNQSQSHK
jgi:hypothetical protein